MAGRKLTIDGVELLEAKQPVQGPRQRARETPRQTFARKINRERLEQARACHKLQR